MPVKNLTKISPTWAFYIAISCVFLVGGALRFWIPLHLDEKAHPTSVETVKGVGEALIVAALLAGVVDPYVKFRLGKEVGREIPKETAGEHLPEELRQALEGIQDIKLYMRRMVIDCTLEDVDGSDNLLKWRMTMHYEVENASWKRRKFEHKLTITDAKSTKLKCR